CVIEARKGYIDDVGIRWIKSETIHTTGGEIFARIEIDPYLSTIGGELDLAAPPAVDVCVARCVGRNILNLENRAGIVERNRGWKRTGRIVCDPGWRRRREKIVSPPQPICAREKDIVITGTFPDRIDECRASLIDPGVCVDPRVTAIGCPPNVGRPDPSSHPIGVRMAL